MTDKLLSDLEAQALDNLMPGNQNAKLGQRIQELQAKGIVAQQVAVTADATSGGKTFVAEYSGILVDATALCTASNASGSLTLRRSSTAITNAMAAVTVDLLARTTTVVNAQKAITKGETLNVVANGAGDRGVVTLFILRT